MQWKYELKKNLGIKKIVWPVTVNWSNRKQELRHELFKFTDDTTWERTKESLY